MSESTEVQPLHLRIPPHEGRHVHASAMKITGSMPMDDLEGTVVGIDDVVTMMCQFKVINIHHNTTPKGDLIRLQVLRPIVMMLAPMDPNDEESAIIRALPEIVEKKVEPVCTCGTADTDHDRTCMLVKILQMDTALAEGEKLSLGFKAAPPAALQAGADE